MSDLLCVAAPSHALCSVCRLRRRELICGEVIVPHRRRLRAQLGDRPRLLPLPLRLRQRPPRRMLPQLGHDQQADHLPALPRRMEGTRSRRECGSGTVVLEGGVSEFRGAGGVVGYEGYEYLCVLALARAFVPPMRQVFERADNLALRSIRSRLQRSPPPRRRRMGPLRLGLLRRHPRRRLRPQPVQEVEEVVGFPPFPVLACLAFASPLRTLSSLPCLTCCVVRLLECCLVPLEYPVVAFITHCHPLVLLFVSRESRSQSRGFTSTRIAHFSQERIER